MNEYQASIDWTRLCGQSQRATGGEQAWYRDEQCWNCDPPAYRRQRGGLRALLQRLRAPRDERQSAKAALPLRSTVKA